VDNNNTYNILTLGDSYTIGEGVPLFDGYPYQTVQLLRKQGYAFAAPEIVARTGWTTDELNNAMGNTRLLSSYDFVTLLIGVNDQYRGRRSGEYSAGFPGLLRQAIQLAAGRADHVFVLSIPDWGVSPFAAGRNKAPIAREIDEFNNTARRVAAEYGVAFIDITSHSRTEGQPFAPDGLHPAGQQYRFWAERLAAAIAQRLP
jgi:lysophospholipase L1-like esterase